MPASKLRIVGQVRLRALTLVAGTCIVAAATTAPAGAGNSVATSASSEFGQQYAAVQRVTASLNGLKEVPNGDRNGTGHVTVRLRPAAGTVCARATWHRIGRPAAAHIHRGRAGVNGDVVVDLTRSVTDGANCARGVRKALIRKIIEHPRRFYFNIHNRAAYPAGAIRGQLHN